MSREPEYLDFEVQVAPNTNGDLEVQVLISPRDRPRARFEAPCTQAEALDLLGSLEAMIKHGIRHRGADKGGGPDLRHLGEGFFTSLFPPALQETLDASLAGSGREALRLRISFDPRDEDLASISALPWEILFHPGKRQFLARSENVAFLRYLDVPVDIRRFHVALPLRVLLIAPTPIDSKASNVLKEQKAVNEALGKLEEIDVECVKPPTLDRLIEKLSERETHVIHFMGHGGLDRKGGRSGVFFEDRNRKKHCVVGPVLAERLVPFFPSLKLVVLNSCYGAAGRRRPDQPPFGAVSAALIANGLTAVVGMQFLISNIAAKSFAEAFYGKLTETGHVEIAALHARRKLVPKDSESEAPEWITPVVLTRAADGRLFDPSSPPSPDEPLRIGIRSIFGWGVSLEDWSHAYFPLTSYFRGRYVNEDVSWQQEIYPRVSTFLRKAIAGRRAIHLDFAAHQSIAFAAGYVLDVQAGIDMTVRQRTVAKTYDWHPDDPQPADSWSWQIEPRELDRQRPDIALVVSATHPIRTTVDDFIAGEASTIGKIVEFKPPAPRGTSHRSIANGWHALQLAQEISNEMYELTPGDWPGMFHLFYAGPNGLLFFLGRLSHGPRRIQLYEYDFDGKGSKTYMPSLVFPPPETAAT